MGGLRARRRPQGAWHCCLEATHIWDKTDPVVAAWHLHFIDFKRELVDRQVPKRGGLSS